MATTSLGATLQGGESVGGTWTDGVLNAITLGSGAVGGSQHSLTPLAGLLPQGDVTFTITPFGTLTDDFTITVQPYEVPTYETGVAVPEQGRPRTIYSASEAFTAGVDTTLTVALNDSDGTRSDVGSPVASGDTKVCFGYTWGGATLVIGVLVSVETEGALFTGLSGPYKAEGRADECPKCGGKSTRDSWTRDGYTEILVCPRCYDPPDWTGRTRIGRERPPINEG